MSDDDEEDLWGDVDETDMSNLHLSANLADVIGVAQNTVHKGDVDEGQVRWVAPTFAGLTNSDTVDSKGGWMVENKSAVVKTGAAPANSAAPAQPGPTALLNHPMNPLNPNFKMPTQQASSKIDWAAMAK